MVEEPHNSGNPLSPNKLAAAMGYLDGAARLLTTLVEGQEAAFDAAAEAIRRTISEDGLVYLFGTGHSHMLAEEGHFRAGGLACVVPVLSSAVMLHESAVASTALERVGGVADVVLSRYPIASRDVLVVFSTSGVNAAPVEAAKHGRAAGATVVAVTSKAYSRQAAAGRETLADVAPIVLDNRAPPGDASVTIAGAVRAGPLSTIAGAALLNALLVEASTRLAAEGVDPPVYVSANMPGAAARNAALMSRYRNRNPHL
ncbi:putative phosphosugar-binding protein [Roseiarcus fermentans]|uniref:Putative phosphosugar-binding protein n=2 Tax=Roseiarcus fermentans TaxID=1473586 RepID=A0A366FBP3_9HYPH|nr:putative phosphosugar-binding protein [Roseiarcus fermentans]